MRRKDIRLKHYDYKNDGYYFVTLCTALKKPLLQQFRKTAEQILLSLPKKIRGVTIDYYEIMPTHLHVILVLKDVELPLGEVIRRYKALVTKGVKIKPFWEWNYYEHIIRSGEALYMIRKYIQENREKERINLQSVYVA
ncbi:MAG: transposase [Candidatus Aerophobetes bacterium]|nr:transposase [Candidatus Aerophobetes bacterium]